MRKEGTQPFWFRQKSGYAIDPYALKLFLELYGFKRFQLAKNHLSPKSPFRYDEQNVLSLQNPLTIKN